MKTTKKMMHISTFHSFSKYAVDYKSGYIILSRSGHPMKTQCKSFTRWKVFIKMRRQCVHRCVQHRLPKYMSREVVFQFWKKIYQIRIRLIKAEKCLSFCGRTFQTQALISITYSVYWILSSWHYNIHICSSKDCG